jgi:hypothetical protein
MGIKQRFFFLKKKFQNGRFSKWPFFKIAVFKIANSQKKFHGLVLGLVGLIDAKGIDVAQLIWS